MLFGSIRHEKYSQSSRRKERNRSARAGTQNAAAVFMTASFLVWRSMEKQSYFLESNIFDLFREPLLRGHAGTIYNIVMDDIRG